MDAPRSHPRRGLLAGLLALAVFVSAAVAMTAGGSSASTTTAAPTTASVALQDGDGDGGHDARFGGHHH